MQEYDYIVVGAGSAGCIVAEQLSASGRDQVLIIEAGGRDAHPWFKMPLGYGKLYYHTRYNWQYHTVPQAELADREIYVPRGKVQGGSGAINAMIYVRGAPQDFDDWATATDDSGWSYAGVLPWFKHLETHWNTDSTYYGQQGNIHVSSLQDHLHPVCQPFLQACESLGYTLNHGFNGEQLEGYGSYDVNIDRGVRDSSSRAFLRAALHRPNLNIMHHTHSKHICVDAQKRAYAVCVQQGSRSLTLHARREIIVCTGAIDTPKLLELSGIGDAKHLQSLGIPVQAHLPKVGANLQDHLCASYYYETRQATLNQLFSSWWGLGRMALQYALYRQGPLAQSVNQTGAFLKSQAHLAHPDIQLYFNPLSYTIPKHGRQAMQIDPYPGVLIALSPCRPQSRGHVHAASADYRDAPLIDPRYLSAAEDRTLVINGHQLLRRLSASPALQQLFIAEKRPGLQVEDEAAILDYYRTQGGSIYHVCGSCTMGKTAADSVVDSHLRVHGINGLRIVDASVLPNITSGNINAPVMMLAARAAALIRAA